jgi:hypothetical protein
MLLGVSNGNGMYPSAFRGWTVTKATRWAERKAKILLHPKGTTSRLSPSLQPIPGTTGWMHSKKHYTLVG